MNSNKNRACSLNLLAIVAVVFALASCAQGRGDASSSASSESSSVVPSSESTPISSSESSSSSPDGHYDLWSKEAQELMDVYCGGALPFPSDIFVGEVSVEEVENSDGSYLQICQQSDSFTLKDYYKTLETFGWNAIYGYKDSPVKINNNGIEYVEATKASSDETVGYDMLYYFSPAQEDEEGNVTFPACNVIQCYNDLAPKASSSSTWSEQEASTIKYVTTTTLPFIQLGERNAVVYTSFNNLYIFDYYVKDLSKEYSDLLVKDGFVVDSFNSIMYNCYILKKTLPDGSRIDVMIYYYGGNNIQMSYTPKETTYSSWPSEIISEIKEKSGVAIPMFETEEGGSYSVFRKNDTYYISTYDRSSTFNYETYTYNELQIIDLTWSERITFETFDLLDSDYVAIGFQVVATLTNPTSTFVSSYPSSAVSETISSTLKISDVTVPSFDETSLPDNGQSLKYSIKGEEYYAQRYAFYYEDIKEFPTFYGLSERPTEEQIKAKAHELAYQEEGITVSIFDENKQAYESYEETLYKACWYKYSDEYGNPVYEDASGTLAVTLSSTADEKGQTSFFFHPGKGEKHTPEFSFDSSEYSVGIGRETELGLVISMLPYEVTYSSSDPTNFSVDSNGVVTVSETVEEGTQATITATMNVPGKSKPLTATCKLTAEKVIYYSIESALAAIKDNAASAGYSLVDSFLDDSPALTLDLGENADASVIKEAIDSSFIPEGMTADGEWESDEIYTIYGDQREGEYLNYSIFNNYCYVIVEFSLYQNDGHLMLQIFAY